METKEVVNATKDKKGADDALELLEGMKDLYVCKGKKVTHVALNKDRPDDETLTKLMLGPTGNLRAPTIRKGKTIVVGFNDDIYGELFG